MNSLAYLSRQFDVLASAKTPPSTPSTEHPPDLPLKRVKTWSTGSFLFSPPSTSHSYRPQRRSSFSSSDSHVSSARVAAASKPPSLTLETQILPKPRSDSFIGRIYLIRILAWAWETFRRAWTSLITNSQPGGQVVVTSPSEKPELVVEESTDDETLVSSSSRLLVVDRRTSVPPAISISPADSPLSHGRVSDSASSTPRSATPTLTTRKSPFHFQKTLVLDLDETLIHSTSRPMPHHTGSSGLFGLRAFGSRKAGAGHVVEVVLGGRSTLYHVYKRPFVDFFLRTVSGWYTLVIFTASMKEYADPVIDWLDAGRGILGNRLFRDSCTLLPNGSYTKDLTMIEPDLARVCLVDNSPVSYRVNEANGIPIEGWTHDPSDEALLDLLPVLDSLRFTSDVRRVLGLRIAGVHSS
ncbi:Nuclear envelope morphology protein 1 [Marasmius crinis-equi]|uniref:Nuclear envelope morphology protein 1 n=1 Tax=Marasmius crinis-equi TaxID=585013 RepID=A0ABR3FQK8_9AGAR